MKKRKRIATVCAFITVVIVFVIFCGPYLWVSTYSMFFGQRDIIDTVKEITANESNSVAILNKIANWLNSHITYDVHGFYFYPMPPLFLGRKVPADPAWTMTIRRGACEEEAVLCTEMVRKIGMQARVVYNPAEDHTWCEVLINGSWVHFNPGLSEDKRFNDPGFYECPKPEGWGKELSYVYFIDADGKQNDITKTYTDTGRLTIQVEKDGQPVKNARVIIESRFLMLNYSSSYSQPKFCLENRTDDNGLCTFDLGGNNYTVSAELGTIFGYRNESVISLKENSETSVTLTLSSFSLLIPIDYVVATLVVALVVTLLAIKTIMIYKKIKMQTPNKRGEKNLKSHDIRLPRDSYGN